MSSKLIKYLPAIYQRGAEDDKSLFIEDYLKIFEHILLNAEGEEEGGKKGLGEIIDSLGGLFNPRFSFACCDDEADKEKAFNSYVSAEMGDFLEWLAGWSSLALKEDWPQEKKRKIIARIIPLYRMRGTKRGLEEYLKIYVGEGVSIMEEMSPFQVEETSYVEKESVLEGMPPYFFIVNISLPVPDPEIMKKRKKAVEEIIDAEKPIHTRYKLNIEVPTLQVGMRSRVEIDTLL